MTSTSSAAAALLQQAELDALKRHSTSFQPKEPSEKDGGSDVVTRAELLIQKLALAKKSGGSTTATPKRRTKEEYNSSSAFTPQQCHLSCPRSSSKQVPPGEPFPCNNTAAAPDFLTATTVEDMDDTDTLLSGYLLDSPDASLSLYSKSSTRDLETKLLDEARTRALAAEQDGALEEAGLQADLAEVNARKMERAMATWARQLNDDEGAGGVGVGTAVSSSVMGGIIHADEEEDDLHSSKPTTTTAGSPTDDLSSVGSGSAFSYGPGGPYRQQPSAAQVRTARTLTEFLRRQEGEGDDVQLVAEALRSLVEEPPDDTNEEEDEEGEEILAPLRERNPIVDNNDDDDNVSTLLSVASASAREERSAVDAAEEQSRRMAEEVSLIKDAASASVASQQEGAVALPSKRIERHQRDSYMQRGGEQNDDTCDGWRRHWSKEHRREYYHNPATDEVCWDRPPTHVPDDAEIASPAASPTHQTKASMPPISRRRDWGEEDDEHSVPLSDYTNSSIPRNRRREAHPRGLATASVAGGQKAKLKNDDHVPVSDYHTKWKDRCRDMIRPSDVNGESNRTLDQFKKKRKRRRRLARRVAVAVLVLAFLSTMGWCCLVFIRSGTEQKSKAMEMGEGIDTGGANGKARRGKTKKKGRTAKEEPRSLPSSSTGGRNENNKKKVKKKRKKKTEESTRRQQGKSDMVDAKLRMDETDSAAPPSTTDVGPIREENMLNNVLGAVPVFFFTANEEEEGKCMHAQADGSCDSADDIKPSTVDDRSGLSVDPTKFGTVAGDDAETRQSESAPPEETVQHVGAFTENASSHDNVVNGETSPTAMIFHATDEGARAAAATTMSQGRVMPSSKRGCRVPLAHLVSNECRRVVEDRPLFDLQKLTDSMMQ